VSGGGGRILWTIEGEEEFKRRKRGALENSRRRILRGEKKRRRKNAGQAARRGEILLFPWCRGFSDEDGNKKKGERGKEYDCYVTAVTNIAKQKTRPTTSSLKNLAEKEGKTVPKGEADARAFKARQPRNFVKGAGEMG